MVKSVHMTMAATVASVKNLFAEDLSLSLASMCVQTDFSLLSAMLFLGLAAAEQSKEAAPSYNFLVFLCCSGELMSCWTVQAKHVSRWLWH